MHNAKQGCDRWPQTSKEDKLHQRSSPGKGERSKAGTANGY